MHLTKRCFTLEPYPHPIQENEDNTMPKSQKTIFSHSLNYCWSKDVPIITHANHLHVSTYQTPILLNRCVAFIYFMHSRESDFILKISDLQIELVMKNVLESGHIFATLRRINHYVVDFVIMYLFRIKKILWLYATCMLSILNLYAML
ncbi:hypothetical protein ACJX0J_013146, partial [Zea mays]